jgi:transcriptional regulator of aromatic amino acid metabolism
MGKTKRRGKPGNVKQLTAVLWRAMSRLEEALDDLQPAEPLLPGVLRAYSEPTIATLCKLTHAMSQAAGTYLKALEVGELEARLAALEAAQAAETAEHYPRAA